MTLLGKRNNSLYILGFIVLVSSSFQGDEMSWTRGDNVSEILFSLGEPKPDHFTDELSREWVQRGRDIVYKGRALGPDGKMGGYISKFYNCIHCHNTVREDPVLNMVDQEARLQYAIDNKLPYLQASTFWGIVNRETWYNDDYKLKYGDLVTDCVHDLKNSAQLCANVCSQGSGLNEWEMKSVISYFWSLQYKLEDLDLTDEEMSSLNDPAANKAELRKMLKSKYLTKSPATFTKPPADFDKGYPGLKGRPEKGMAIFALSCRYCHRVSGPSKEHFENDIITYKWLANKISSNSKESFYNVIRYGTSPETGDRAYMPHFTAEKMSDQQVEDLRSFIESKAN